MRVDDPMLSIVATRRKADKRSGASVLSARQAPLNSSSSAMMSSISGSMISVLVLMVSAINPTISSHKQRILLYSIASNKSSHIQPYQPYYTLGGSQQDAECLR